VGFLRSIGLPEFEINGFSPNMALELTALGPLTNGPYVLDEQVDAI